MSPTHIDLDIIKYNSSHYAISISMLIVYSTVLISIYIPFLQWHILARIASVLFVIIFVIFRYSDLYYKRIGKITLYSNGGVLVKYFDSEKLLWISALVINYGGYDGEPKALDVFFTGSGFRDGTRNLFIIYSNQLQKGEKPLRVLIKSKQQAVDLKLIANELAENGVTIDIKKSHWMRIPF